MVLVVVMGVRSYTAHLISSVPPSSRTSIAATVQVLAFEHRLFRRLGDVLCAVKALDGHGEFFAAREFNLLNQADGVVLEIYLLVIDKVTCMR